MKYRILFLLLMTFFSFQLRATHIVGGEMTYRCLGNDQYEITLQVFRDCYTGVPWFDPQAWVAVYTKDWVLFSEVQIEYDGSNDTLPIILTNPCLTAPPDVCVNTATYKSIITLPYIAGGYTLVYQRCCRNQLIRNIIDPLDTGASFLVEISEKALNECNASAVFNTWPPVAICVHNPIDFDHGATDPDGDSLVYSLCTPLNGGSMAVPQPMPPPPGPYDEIVWQDPYDLVNVLGGEPLTIDANTGFLTGIPNMLGNYVVGVCVSEYRNGEIISTTRRDFQYNVADCGEPVAAFFAPEVLCDTKKITFDNQSSQANFYKWFFDFENNPNASFTNFEPTWTYADTGLYTVALIANPGANCTDTFFQQIHITQRFINADFEVGFPDCSGGGLTIKVNNLSIDTIYDQSAWSWTLRGPAGFIRQSMVENPEFVVNNGGQYTLSLIVTSGNGCLDTLNRTFNAPFPIIDQLQTNLSICKGDTIPLFPNSSNIGVFNWTPSNTLSNGMIANPLAFPQTTTTYSLVVTSDQSPCTLQRDVTVNVEDPGTLTLTATPPSLILGETTVLEAVFSKDPIQFGWLPDPTLSATNILDPTASPKDSTTYYMEGVFPNECILRGNILVPVIFPSCDEPFVFFPTGFSPNGDTQNDVLKVEGSFITEVYWVIYDRWGEKIFEANSVDDVWDGTYQGKDMPAETYGYYLKLKCLNGKESSKKGNITLLR